MESSYVKERGLNAIFGSTTITGIQGFNFIGYIGWITTNFTGAVCGETTGYMAVKVDYFYANATLNGKVYHGFLVHIEHSAKGYQTTCCSLTSCSTINHYPKTFISKTDWKTTMWPGQVLDDWQPKNASSASNITYQIAWGTGAQSGSAPIVSVSYSTPITESNHIYYEWYDTSDPPYGVAAAKHILNVPSGYDESKLNNVLFTVAPSSIGFLDPDKPGGSLPMIISHTFETELNTGDKASISFSVKLFPIDVYKL
ncbi:hypothetical protein ACSU1N_03530 [Thermogladius sp. 4427co]|uniref:hypothetical protein n=1 Tax=Thermogladius sp. 4427co TaxID=3450718 RepID=UPI003F78BD5F